MEEPEFIEEMEGMGLPIQYLGPEEYKEFNIKEKRTLSPLFYACFKLISGRLVY